MFNSLTIITALTKTVGRRIEGERLKAKDHHKNQHKGLPAASATMAQVERREGKGERGKKTTRGKHFQKLCIALISPAHGSAAALLWRSPTLIARSVAICKKRNVFGKAVDKNQGGSFSTAEAEEPATALNLMLDNGDGL